MATATEAIQAGAIAVAEVITMDGIEAIIAIDENPHCLRVIIPEEVTSVWRPHARFAPSSHLIP